VSRPAQKNALTVEMYAAWADALDAASADDSVRVVVMRGAGGSFTAGNDLKDFLERPPSGDDAPVFRFLRTLATFPKPLIAEVEGFAVGVGTTVLLHCDLVYAADDATLALPFTNLGVVPEAASSLLLPLALGHVRASELLLFGDPFGAAKALELGLVNRVVPKAELRAFVAERAAKLASKSAAALRETKALLRGHLRDATLRQMKVEVDVFTRLLATDETKKTLRGFFERKR
jgi:enoyl-CoA hydratase/carnithine racemase